MSGVSALLFDLDGTIIDSAPDVCASVNRVLETMNRPPITVVDTKAFVGFGARTLVEKALEMTGEPGSDDDIDFSLAGFLDSYRQNPREHSTIFPGAREALDRFKTAGIALGICTNKPEALAETLLTRLGVREAFGALVGADTLPVRKPDPAPFYEAVDRIGGDRTRSVLVGDSDTDRNTARNAGVPSILVTFGPSGDDMAALAPDALLNDFADFETVLDAVLPR